MMLFNILFGLLIIAIVILYCSFMNEELDNAQQKHDEFIQEMDSYYKSIEELNNMMKRNNKHIEDFNYDLDKTLKQLNK